MKNISFEEALEQILKTDDRFDEMAYHFIREALDFTVKMLDKPLEGPGRHVSGAELLEGIRRYALDEYGPMTRTLLRRWGINSTADFGALVFNLVSKGILGKTEEDRMEDFANGYDFDKAFVIPYQPASVPEPKQKLPRKEAR